MKTPHLLAIALLAATTYATAQPYPTKQVQVVVPFAAGSVTDMLARIVAQRLAEALGRRNPQLVACRRRHAQP